MVKLGIRIIMKSNYNKYPAIALDDNNDCFDGWDSIGHELKRKIDSLNKKQAIVIVEFYQGILKEDLSHKLQNLLKPDLIINAEEAMFDEDYIREMVYQDVTDDRIFGYMTRLTINDFFDPEKIDQLRQKIRESKDKTVLIYGTGASLIAERQDVFVYADMARWEIQKRMRRHEVDNLGIRNRNIEDWMLLYKQGFFVDWRVCDRNKKELFERFDYVLDTNERKHPKMMTNEAVMEGYRMAVNQPFSVVPFFDPGPWGGQWMKEVCGLDQSRENYAWCFNCVPEENSLLFKVGDVLFELPSINLVLIHPRELLGDPVHARFGDEFPIRFDFLDTMEGGNLSLQVHPLTEYIQEKFGMHYTQDESYYIMDAEKGAVVYLGLKEGVDPEKCIKDLRQAANGGESFDDTKHIQQWKVSKHDHVMIPGGTVHCSGKNSMVLEISATPYIFTFKLWDWGRLGLDGKPRPINIEHGKNVIQWYRTTEWTKKNLINCTKRICEADGWIEEQTGLHEREFIETRRHWFKERVEHYTKGSVNVICLVEGREVIVESPANKFNPFIVHYAEVFIVPANVSSYTIRPYGESEGMECATIKAYVRY